MPDAPQRGPTPQHVSALEEYERRLASTARAQTQLNTTVTTFSRLMSPSGVPQGLGQLTKGLGDITSRMEKLQQITGRNNNELRMFANRWGSAVTAGGAFLSMIDSIEKKQGQLQRAYGITNVSMKEYHEVLADVAQIGGTAAVESAKQVIDVLAAQRRNGKLTGDQFEELTKTYVKYTLALSQNFPQDFVRMQQDLGMTATQVTNEYEQLGYQAAQARIPFEQYKNTVFDVTSRFVKYGTTLGDVRGAFNLFVDDVSKGTITLGEAAEAINRVIDVQQTAGGLQKRAVLSKYISENWQDLGEDLRKELNKVAGEEYQGKGFGELTAVQRQYVMGRVAPETYQRAEADVYKILEKQFGKERMQLISPQLFTAEAGEMQRRAAAVTTGAGVTPPSEKAMEDYRKSLDEIVQKNEEWYSSITSLILEFKSLISDLGTFGKVLGAAAVSAAGYGMTGIGFRSGRTGGITGGMTSAMGRTTGEMGLGSKIGMFSGYLTLLVATFQVWDWAFKEIEKAGGLYKFYEDLTHTWGKVKSFFTGGDFGEEGKLQLTGTPEHQLKLAAGLIKGGDIDLAEELIRKSPTLEQNVVAEDLLKLIEQSTLKKFRGQPGSDISKMTTEELPSTVRHLFKENKVQVNIELAPGLVGALKSSTIEEANKQIGINLRQHTNLD